MAFRSEVIASNNLAWIFWDCQTLNPLLYALCQTVHPILGTFCHFVFNLSSPTWASDLLLAMVISNILGYVSLGLVP